VSVSGCRQTSTRVRPAPALALARRTAGQLLASPHLPRGEDVGALDVAVHHALLVQVLEAAQHLEGREMGGTTLLDATHNALCWVVHTGTLSD
jgi:hypothetical protein